MLYKNTTFMVQVLNTNKGRGLHVPAQETVELKPGEEQSQEIKYRLSQHPPQGLILDGPAPKEVMADEEEGDHSHE
jgi:hypothetical protein